MKIELRNPPRVFAVGKRAHINISDCGSIFLAPDEQVTFVNDKGQEVDVVAKDWGYYITPSINSRLLKQGYKTAITRNSQGRLYVKVVEKERVAEFEEYIRSEKSEIIEWLDEREQARE